MGRWAVIRDATSKVENVIAWDGVTPWQAPVGCSVRELTKAADIQACEPGSAFDAGKQEFTRPVPPPLDPAVKIQRGADLQLRIDALSKLSEIDFPGSAAEVARLTALLEELKASR